jgi:tripartite-type tricarboxylate transporter receptor subunit TctC
MMLSRRHLLHLAASAAAFPLAARTAQADNFPMRLITIVVPFPAGGPADAIARLLAEHMRGSLGQPVIVENVAGAGGSLGVGKVARAAPDGYTLSIGQLNSHVFAGAVYSLQFDLLKDFDPVALLTTNPQMLVGRKDLPAQNMKELIAWLRSNSDKATYATPGIGSPSHVWGVHFQNITGTRFQFVPYRGAAPAMQGVLSGQLDLACLQASDLLPQVRSGNLIPYAILSDKPWARALDIPTVDAAGVPGLDMPFWHGLWAPANTPRDVIAKLNGAVIAAMNDPSLRQRFADIGQEIFPRGQETPEALAQLQKAEIEKWWPIIKAANIKAG